MRGQRAGKGPNLFGDDTSSQAAVPVAQLRLDEEDISITLRRAWDRALRMLAQRVNKPTFETHLRGLRPLSLSEESDDRGRTVWNITLGAPSAFTREWVEKRHAPIIGQTLEEIFDARVVLRFALSPKETTGTVVSAAPAPVAPVTPSAPTRPHPSREVRQDAANAALALDLDIDDVTSAPSPKAATQGYTEATQPVASTVATQEPNPVPQSIQEQRRANVTNGSSRTNSTSGSNSGSTGPAPAYASGNTSGPAVQASSSRSSHPDAVDMNPRYTFDRFVVGGTNRLAHGGALAVAEAPGERFNPLFLYGSPGLGKTHLMHAIGNAYIKARGEGAARRVAYMSGETFTTQFVTSLRQQKAEEFRRRSRNVDLWLVDDIQFIAGKEGTKEEFFHTFNALYQAGKQIVICSDRSPRELRDMDERLRSRFECGLVADIAAPDLETRLAILQKKAENEGSRVPDDVLLYMARLVQSNIRTLEGALVKLVAYASLVNSPVTTQMAAGILEKYFIAAGTDGGRNYPAPTVSGSNLASLVSAAPSFPSRSPQPTTSPTALPEPPGPEAALTADMVQRAVANRFGLTPDALTGKRRDRDAVNARQVAMHLMRELTEISLPGIGQIFGGRDHTTVIHACDRVKAQMPFDPDLRKMVEDLRAQMSASGAAESSPGGGMSAESLGQ